MKCFSDYIDVIKFLFSHVFILSYIDLDVLHIKYAWVITLLQESVKKLVILKVKFERFSHNIRIA